MEEKLVPRATVAEVLNQIMQKQPTSGATEYKVERFMENTANTAGKSASEIAQSYLDNVENVSM